MFTRCYMIGGSLSWLGFLPDSSFPAQGNTSFEHSSTIHSDCSYCRGLWPVEEEEDYIIASNILPPPHSLLLLHMYKYKYKHKHEYTMAWNSLPSIKILFHMHYHTKEFGAISLLPFLSFSESNQCWLSNFHVFLKGENDKGVQCAKRPYDTGQSAVRVRPMGIGPCSGHCCGRTQASGARGLRVACKG